MRLESWELLERRCGFKVNEGSARRQARLFGTRRVGFYGTLLLRDYWELNSQKALGGSGAAGFDAVTTTNRTLLPSAHHSNTLANPTRPPHSRPNDLPYFLSFSRMYLASGRKTRGERSSTTMSMNPAARSRATYSTGGSKFCQGT